MLVGSVVHVASCALVLGVYDCALMRMTGSACCIHAARTGAQRDVVTIHARDGDVSARRNGEDVVRMRSANRGRPSAWRMTILAGGRKHIVPRIGARIVVCLMAADALSGRACVNGRYVAVARGALGGQMHADQRPRVYKRRRAKAHCGVTRGTIHGQTVFMNRRFDGVVILEMAADAFARRARINRRRAYVTSVACSTCVRVGEGPLMHERRRTEGNGAVTRRALERKGAHVNWVSRVVVVGAMAAYAVALPDFMARVRIAKTAPEQGNANACHDPGKIER